MKTIENEDPKDLKSETTLWPEPHPTAKTNLIEMNREEIGKVVRNLLKLWQEIDARNLN
ncbi:MAG TPA: hypothetical protein VIK64_15385 [Anaerolineales bacterium]